MSSAADRFGILVAVAYLAAALHGLGAADIVGDDEAREAGIVQDVVAGHWLLPTFNGEILPDKPIGFHWLAAVPCAVAGFSEAAVRLPSALAGAALVGWTARFGASLFGPAAGLAAAVMLATTPAMFARARVARPDALLVLLLALAMGLAFRWWREGRRRDASAALACLGAATLVKGPVAPVLFALAFGGFLAWQRELRRASGLLTAPGVAVFLVLALGWYAIALAGWGELFVREHLVGRYLRNLAGGMVTGGSYSKRSLPYHLGFYVLHLPAIALPWTPVAAVALWRAWRRDRLRDPRVRFLLCWAAAPVVAFTPAEYKLRYYLLPALPALALLGGPALAALRETRARHIAGARLARLGAVAAIAAGLALWLGTAALGQLARSDRNTLEAVVAATGGHVPLAGALVAGVAAIAVASACRAWRVLAGALVVGMAGWMVVGQPGLERAISGRDSLKPFAMAVVGRYPAPAAVGIFGESIRPLAVYLARRVPTLRRRDALAPGLAVIVTEPAYARLESAGLLGPALLDAEGRIGNLGRARVVLAETRPAS